MNKFFIVGLVIVVLIIGGFFALNSYIYKEKQAPTAANHKNAEYMIGGAQVRLINGVAETEAAPGSATKIVTRYFGQEIFTDLDADLRQDVAFILTQESGGSGVFYYAVAALSTDEGYIGSDGYLLGDRIAPQTLELSQNPRHKNVIVVNFADRAPGEPMTAEPSVGKSVYLKIDRPATQWGIVEPNFEGESDITPIPE